MIVNHLTPSPGMAYASFVLDKERNGFDSLIYKKRTGRAMRLFYVRMLSFVPMGGGSREASACRFSFLYRSVNPVICRPPRLTAGSGSISQKGVSHD
jgi:hypothetical protein